MLLDTNAISAWAKGDAGLLQALRPDRTWYLPGIALGEYRYGLLKSIRRAELEAWLESIEAASVVGAPVLASALYSSVWRVHCAASSRTFPGMSAARFFVSERSALRS